MSTMMMAMAVWLLGAATATVPAAPPASNTALSPAGAANPPPPPPHLPTYTSKYDNINVDMILRNEMMLKGYMDCLMDRKPCTKEGKLLKEIIPDALRTECARCTPKQKEQAGHILSYLLQHRKHYWNELIAKYDPECVFRKKYEVEEDDEEDDGEESNEATNK